MIAPSKDSLGSNGAACCVPDGGLRVRVCGAAGDPSGMAPYDPRPAGGRDGSDVPRLFGPLAEATVWKQPHEMRSFNAALRGDAELAKQHRLIVWTERLLLLLAGLQTACAVGFFSSLVSLPEAAGTGFLMFATVLSAASGLIGLAGVLRKSAALLQWHFISQMWALSQAVIQVVRSQMSHTRFSIFCEEVEVARQSYSCVLFGRDMQIVTLVVSSVVVYASVFFADALAEAYQDLKEVDNQRLITHFIWSMRKNSLNSISRFEDLIHAQFSELVSLGYLKIRMG